MMINTDRERASYPRLEGDDLAMLAMCDRSYHLRAKLTYLHSFPLDDRPVDWDNATEAARDEIMLIEANLAAMIPDSWVAAVRVLRHCLEILHERQLDPDSWGTLAPIEEMIQHAMEAIES